MQGDVIRKLLTQLTSVGGAARLLLSLFVLWGGSGCGGGTTGSEGGAVVSKRIQGRVIDLTEHPLADLSVTLLESGDSVNTDTNGMFVIQAEQFDSYRLQLESSSVMAVADLGVIPEGPTVTTVELLVDASSSSASVRSISTTRDDGSAIDEEDDDADLTILGDVGYSNNLPVDLGFIFFRDGAEAVGAVVSGIFQTDVVSDDSVIMAVLEIEDRIVNVIFSGIENDFDSVHYDVVLPVTYNELLTLPPRTGITVTAVQTAFVRD